jgi:hypothetical protein
MCKEKQNDRDLKKKFFSAVTASGGGGNRRRYGRKFVDICSYINIVDILLLICLFDWGL